LESRLKDTGRISKQEKTAYCKRITDTGRISKQEEKVLEESTVKRLKKKRIMVKKQSLEKKEGKRNP
jgi:hypothetical protein